MSVMGSVMLEENWGPNADELLRRCRGLSAKQVLIKMPDKSGDIMFGSYI